VILVGRDAVRLQSVADDVRRVSGGASRGITVQADLSTKAGSDDLIKYLETTQRHGGKVEKKAGGGRRRKAAL
jgi:hypothetical protein